MAATVNETDLEQPLVHHGWPSVSTYEEEGKSFNVDYLVKVISLISLMKWLLYWNIL